ncbi:hypothetical protein BDN71DRAFT_1510921 [Pleurotus eryngii]|uniref:Uncharacterized protein n=1 Tax=Pleurotus eryngii TaxID=5323 RepID=A0A9P5ZMK6_PLEER|nr:hypothetical protein BDN71DRAFT_1510921 [Pleurotus eryngii]
MFQNIATYIAPSCAIVLSWLPSQFAVLPNILSFILNWDTLFRPSNPKGQLLAATLVSGVVLFFLASGSVASLLLLSALSAPFCTPGRLGWLSATAFCHALSSSKDMFVKLSGLSETLVYRSTEFQGYSITAAPLLNNLTDVYVETRKILLLVDASRLPSKGRVSTLLLHNSNDIMHLVKGLEELRIVVQSGSDQIKSLDKYVTRSARPLARWIGSDSAFYALAAPFITSRVCVSTPPASIVLEDVVSAFHMLSACVTSSSLSLLSILMRLDARLLDLGKLVNSDGLSQRQSYESLLGHLWTYLGGNKSELTSLLYDIDTIHQAGVYVLAATRFNFDTLQAVERMRTRANSGHTLATGNNIEKLHSEVQALEPPSLLGL